jgi:hypothetical protein
MTALRRVAQAFRAKFGQWVWMVGFEGVWIAGPVAALVHRLDDGGC